MTDPLTQPGMVERVARALAKRQGHILGDMVGPAILGSAFAADARAAIEEMFNPTQAMLEACPSAGSWGPTGWGGHTRFEPSLAFSPRSAWHAMVTAALSEQRGA